MFQTVHLRLRIDGREIEGESKVTSFEREDTIECLSFYYECKTPLDTTTGQISGKPRHMPTKIRKRIDKSTPLLLKALYNNETVDSAEFRFFRPELAGTGQVEHFFTVRLENGYICSVQQVSEDVVVAGEAAPPMIEEVKFVSHKIAWTYETTGTTYEFSLGHAAPTPR